MWKGSLQGGRGYATTNHILTKYQVHTNHILSPYWPHTNNLYCDHIPTTFTDQIPTTFTDHTLTRSTCSVLPTWTTALLKSQSQFLSLFNLCSCGHAGIPLFFFSDCTAPLGMQNGQILDQQLSSSSYYSKDTSPKFARLNTTKGFGWCPNQTVKWYSDRDGGPYYDQYFQVTFSHPVRITAIATQGRAKDKHEFLAKFHVNYTLGNSHWKEVINVKSGTLVSLILSLLRVINVKFPLQKYYIRQ